MVAIPAPPYVDRFRAWDRPDVAPAFRGPGNVW